MSDGRLAATAAHLVRPRDDRGADIGRAPTPAADGPDRDNAARARQKAAVRPPTERDERFYEVGRHIQRVEPAPLPPEEHGCPRCQGLQQTIRLLEDERAQLRKQLARHELPATRGQQLRPSEQLP